MKWLGRFEIFSWDWTLLSFISYASTKISLELMIWIAWSFAYCSLWYNDMKACKFLIQNLGSFHLENTKQGKLLCSTLPIPIPKPFTHTYKFKPIAIFLWARSNISTSEESLDCSSLWVIHIHVHHPKSFNHGCKIALHPSNKERKIWTAFMPVQ